MIPFRIACLALLVGSAVGAPVPVADIGTQAVATPQYKHQSDPRERSREAPSNIIQSLPRAVARANDAAIFRRGTAASKLAVHEWSVAAEAETLAGRLWLDVCEKASSSDQLTECGAMVTRHHYGAKHCREQAAKHSRILPKNRPNAAEGSAEAGKRIEDAQRSGNKAKDRLVSMASAPPPPPPKDKKKGKKVRFVMPNGSIERPEKGLRVAPYATG